MNPGHESYQLKPYFDEMLERGLSVNTGREMSHISTTTMQLYITSSDQKQNIDEHEKEKYTEQILKHYATFTVCTQGKGCSEALVLNLKRKFINIVTTA